MARTAELQLHPSPTYNDQPVFLVVHAGADVVRFTGASPRKDGALDLSALLRCLREVAAQCATHHVDHLRLTGADFEPLDPAMLAVVVKQLMPAVTVEVTGGPPTEPAPGGALLQEDNAGPVG